MAVKWLESEARPIFGKILEIYIFGGSIIFLKFAILKHISFNPGYSAWEVQEDESPNLIEIKLEHCFSQYPLDLWKFNDQTRNFYISPKTVDLI